MVLNVNQLVVLRFLQGIFTGTVTAAVALVASGTPAKRLSFALGFMTSSTYIGASIGPVIGGFLADFAGYRTSFYIGGMLMLFDFILVLFLVKEDKLEASINNEKAKNHVTLFSSFTLSIAIMLFLILVLRFSRSVFNPYLPLFIQELLNDSDKVVKTTGIINGVTGIMSALAGLTLSRLGDRHDKMVMLVVLLISSIGTSVLLPVFARNLWIFTVFYGLFFFILGGIEPVIISITSQKTPAERRGMLFGIQGTVGNIGWAVSPALGSLVSLRYSLKAILILIPLVLILGLISLLLFRRIPFKADNESTVSENCINKIEDKRSLHQ